MQKEFGEELFYYSTKIPKGRRGCLTVILSIMVFALLFLFGSATYFFMNAGEVDADSTFAGDIVLGVFITIGGFVVLPFPLILFLAMIREKGYVEDYLVFTDKIIYKEMYPKKDETKIKELPFSEMGWSLIGNYCRYVPGSGKGSGVRSYYQNEVLLLLKFGDDIYILTINEEADLDKWADLLGENGVALYYLPYNLRNVKKYKEKIDFDSIDMKLWDDSKERKPIFAETKHQVFEDWEPAYK